MSFKLIDMEHWDRAECYQHFTTIAKSTYSITVDLDITEFSQYVKEKKMKFFPAFTWIRYSSFTATNESEHTFLFPMVTWGKFYEADGKKSGAVSGKLESIIEKLYIAVV